MKIIIPKVITSDGGYLVSGSDAISFSEVGPGKFKGLVTLAHTAYNTDTVITSGAYPITIEADATDAQKGRRRILLKVSMPYRRPSVNPETNAIALEGQGAEVSAHLVLSVPKSLISDRLSPTSGDQVTPTVAANTLNTVISLLRCLSVSLGFDNQVADVAGTQYWTEFTGVNSIPTGKAGELFGPTSTLQRLPFVVTSNELTGQLALRVRTGYRNTSTGTNVGLDDLLFDPIARGLHGLRPVEENSEIVAVTTTGDFPSEG